MNALTRISQMLTPCPMTGCWFWLGELNRNGYGRVWFAGVRRAAHRVIYELLVGPIPEGHLLDHKCKIRCCCNPHHLEPVLPVENVRRGEAVLFGAVK